MNKYILITMSLLFTLHGYSQSLTEFIVVDQFGYRPQSEKIAVIRDPVTGYDAAESFVPGDSYALVNAENDQTVYSAAPVVWNGGMEDASSGDRAWWFDFSSVQTEGSYYVLDVDNNVRSFEFDIRPDVYNEVLKTAVRTFFYQRVGHAKEAPYAETGWEDGASHIGPLQDTECRAYDDPNNAATERDVSGGWYDAGDYNKYTTWTANYVYEMMQAYEENPSVWTDDFNIPESGNGTPDLLDEAKWGIDHLLRLQNADGSMIAVVDEAHASPPSSATGPSLYGAVNTSSTLASAGAFAYASKVLREQGMEAYANTLQTAAEDAWTWADANPNVIWRNNDAAYGSDGIGSGQQETDDYGRLAYKMRAAVHLFENTGIASYKTFFDNNYDQIHLIAWNFAYPFEMREQETLLYYTTLPDATASVKNTIISRYNSAMEGDRNFAAYDGEDDPYLAFLQDYTWGSNNTKSGKGNMFYDMILYDVNSARNADALQAAERYVHYIHGVNPQNMTYLTNMYDRGAEKSADQIYHTWFFDGNPLWDEVGVSTYGPAPGFLAGGPNPSYDWDGCCPDGCGSTGNNAICTSIDLTPPKGQPAQKSYLDFNNNWPLNSWSVTENSCGYQIAYIRLLSKFASADEPVTSVDMAIKNSINKVNLYPNPAEDKLNFSSGESIMSVQIIDQAGRIVLTAEQKTADISTLESGMYFAIVKLSSGQQEVKSFIKK